MYIDIPVDSISGTYLAANLTFSLSLRAQVHIHFCALPVRSTVGHVHAALVLFCWSGTLTLCAALEPCLYMIYMYCPWEAWAAHGRPMSASGLEHILDIVTIRPNFSIN